VNSPLCTRFVGVVVRNERDRTRESAFVPRVDGILRARVAPSEARSASGLLFRISRTGFAECPSHETHMRSPINSNAIANKWKLVATLFLFPHETEADRMGELSSPVGLVDGVSNCPSDSRGVAAAKPGGQGERRRAGSCYRNARGFFWRLLTAPIRRPLSLPPPPLREIDSEDSNCAHMGENGLID